MTVTNYKQLLTEGLAFPLAIEAKLPSGAPKISTLLTQATANLPTAPDFPTALPDLPTVPTLPELPTLPTLPTGGAARLGPTAPPQEARTVRVLAANTVYTTRTDLPPGGVNPGGVTTQVITRRGM